MMRKSLAVLIAAALACAGSARCEDVPNYNHPPYQHPFETTLRAAEHGDVAAQVQVGRDYEKALGVEQDFDKAITWYKKAAAASSPQAMLALGLLFEDWRLSQKYKEKAEPWLLRAAETGLAAGELAEAKFHGHHESPTEEKLELEWLERAAAQGDLEAESLLGPRLAISDDPDERKRGEVYIAAAKKAYPRTRFAAESGKFFRDHPAPEHYTGEYPEEFRRAALTLDIEEVGNDSWEAFGILGAIMMIAGTSNTDDPAFRDGTLLQKRLEDAARGGDLQSACNLALDKLDQYHAEKESNKEAFDWYLTAANRGAPRAQYHLGKLYRDGLGTEASASNAAMWFYRAALHGYPPAEAALGDLMLHGNGVPTDYQAALGWLRPAAAYGNPMAQFDLGWMYLNGLGVMKDSDRAIALIAAAAEPIGLNTWSPASDWINKAKSDPAMSGQIAGAAKIILPHRHGVDTAQGGCDEASINSKLEE